VENTAGARNLLSGSLSEYGIFLINADSAVIQGNYIGTDVTGLLPLPNADGGIRILNGTQSAVVGGSGVGEGNVIAYNNGNGVRLEIVNDRQITISQNSMFCNTGEGIDLNGAGNNNHPAPVITTVTAGGVSGTASAGDQIEIYYDSSCTATCQGKDLIASVTADGAGNWSYVGPIVSGRIAANARVVTPGINFGNTSEFSCFVIFPVEGLELSATPLNATSVQLDWTTVQEVSNQRFDVERSQDGSSFMKIGEVAGSGDAPDGARYAFLDEVASGDRLFYRLKQVDFNGEFAYSAVVEVRLPGALAGLQVFPIPADQALQIRLPESMLNPVSASLMDLQGRVISTKLIPAAQSGRTLSMSTAELPQGVYLLEVVHAEGRSVERVMVSH
jgi:hypothetical protein